jgi:uncharacterized protein involved in type VI secretion and phage assembly
VTDNNDPDGLGRIRAKFHWMNGSEKSPWMRVTTPHAGDGKGMFFIPEKGEEVIVGFEGDSPTKPYVIGSVYHGKAKSSFANGGNDVKTFQSRSGNKMVLNDKDGSVLVEDKGGNKMMIDGSGNISISATLSVSISCGGTNITLKSDGSIGLTAKNITISAEEKVTMGTEQASFSAESNGEAKMGGMKATVTGQSEATITGASTTLNGDATAAVKSSGPTSIEGAIVKLN